MEENPGLGASRKPSGHSADSREHMDQSRTSSRLAAGPGHRSLPCRVADSQNAFCSLHTCGTHVACEDSAGREDTHKQNTWAHAVC